MADIKLVGAVAIKVRPDARGFRGETQRAISKELAGVEAEVKVKVKGDTTELKTDVARAKKAVETKEITLKVGLDYDSVRRAQQQLDRAVKGLADEVIKVKLDDEGIADARAQLATLMDNAEVEMTFVPDEKGYKAVLAKIEEIRRQKLEQEISFSIDENSLDELEREMRERLHNGMNEATVHVTYNNNRASIEKAIAQVNAELDKIRQVEFDVTLDKKSLKTARKALEAALAEAPVELRVNYDDQESLKATRERLREMLSELNSKTLSVAFNKEAIRAELHKIDQMIKDEVEDKREVQLPVHTTGLELVARQLQFASRSRRVPFHVVVDQKSLIIAEGLLRSLAGVNTLQAAGRGLERLITKFDTIALKGASWGAAIGGIADSLAYLVTAAFAVGDGMVEVVGLLAAAPAMLAAIAAGAIITTMAFDNMKKAFDGDAKALAALTPAAREAVRVLDDTWTSMQKPVQQAFWEKAGVSLQEFVDKVIPQFRDGLEGAARGAGLAFDNVVKGFNQIAISGDLKKMFANLEILFEKVGHAAGPLVEAFNTLGLRGSEFLPRFGQWILDISTRFRDWINEASRLGDINSWIEDGTNSLKDMWRAGGAIIDQFKAISRAVGLLGNNGLDDFRRNMEHIAQVMLGEPFQSRMGSIFFGARQGAHELNKGVKDLAGSFMESAAWTGQLLTLLGRFGGDVLSSVSRVFSNFTFQNGMVDALRGMSDMVRTMEPAFDRLGSLIGNIGKIASNVFRGLGPVFNTVLGILDDSVSKLEGNLSKLAPGLLTLTNNLLSVARGPITLVVDVLNAFLGVLNGLPGPLRDATLAFGIFLLLRNQFGAFSLALSKMWTGLTTSSVAGAAGIRAATATVGTATSGVQRQLVTMSDGSVRQMTRFGTAVQTGMAAARVHINSFEPGTIASRMATAASGVAAAVGRVNGALALIGGVPGLVLGAIGVAMSVIGGNAAAASANIDRLRDSLDKTSGAATSETLTAIASKVSEIDKAGGAWANFWRGVVNNSKAGNETLDALGISIGKVSRIIAGSRAEYDAFVGSLKTIGNAGNLQELIEFMKTGNVAGDVSKRPMAPGDEFATNVAKLKSLKDQADAVNNLGLNPDILKNIDTQSIKNVTSKIEEQRLAFELAQRGQAIYAQTLGTTVERSKEVAAIVQTIGDVSADAAGKIDAINRSLAILNDNGLSEQESKMARMDNLEAAVENAKAIAESIKASKSVLFDANGIISEQSKAGRDLFKIMSEAADNVKVQAQAAYDSAILSGDTAAAAAAKAVAVVKSGDQDLKRIADGAGLTVEELKAQWGQFFGEDWKLEATFSGNLDNYLAAQEEAKRLGMEFNGQEFMAWLLANPDPANVTTDQVRAKMQDWAATTFQAKLDAMPAPAQAMIADVVGRADAFARGDYKAVLAGFNATEPAVQSAIASIMKMTTPNWQAMLRALVDGGSLATVESQLAFAARNRTAYIVADASSVTNALQRVQVKSATGVPQGTYANGGILNRVAAFANGGIMNRFANGIEKHVASIYRPSSMLRVFAEPETGGEAYIPLAASKRPRSLSILGEVARKFGYELTRSRNYANGSAGGTTVPTRTSQTSVTVGTINTVDPEAAVRKLQEIQRDALAVAGINP